MKIEYEITSLPKKKVMINNTIHLIKHVIFARKTIEIWTFVWVGRQSFVEGQL